jgi:hypothetical protein
MHVGDDENECYLSSSLQAAASNIAVGHAWRVGEQKKKNIVATQSSHIT